jgi:hypothetical protein
MSAALVTATIAVGCDDGGSSDHATTETDGATPIVYQVRGVYPPFLRRVSIDSDDTAEITTRPALHPNKARTRVVQVPDEELAEIRRELESADVDSIDDEGPRLCMDCPEYTVEFGGERHQWFGAVGAPATLRPAVRLLKQL